MNPTSQHRTRRRARPPRRVLRRQEARSVRAKVAWCALPLVWWPGGEHVVTASSIGLPSGAEIVRRALSGRAEGLFALHLEAAPRMLSAAATRTQAHHLGVRVARIERIGPGEIQAAIDGLIKASRVRDQLSFDVDAWRQTAGRRVDLAERALRCPRSRQALCVLAPEAPLSGDEAELARALGWSPGAVAGLPRDGGWWRWLRGRAGLLAHGDEACVELRLQRPDATPWKMLKDLAALAAHGVDGPEVARLVGHLSGRGVTDFTGLVPWFVAAPSKALALEVFETSLARGGRRASDAQALIETLALSGDTLLRQRGDDPVELCSRHTGTPAHVIGQLGDLTPFQRLAAVEFGRWDAMERVLVNRRGALGAYLDRSVEGHIVELSRTHVIARTVCLLSPAVAARVLDALARMDAPPARRARVLGALLDVLGCGWRPSTDADRAAIRLLDSGALAFALAGPASSRIRRVRGLTLALEALAAGVAWKPLVHGLRHWDGNPHLAAAQCRAIVWLTGDLPLRVAPLVAAIPANAPPDHHPILGLNALRTRPRIRWALRSACVRPEDIPRVVAVLRRLALAARYPPFAAVMDGVEAALGRGGDALEQLQRLHGSIPRSVERARTGQVRLEREARALEASGRAPERLAHVRACLKDPKILRGFQAQADRQIQKHLRLAQLQVIEDGASRVFLDHWQGRPRLGDDWDNALRLLKSTKQNRRLLRRMLRAAADGVDLRRVHPGNAQALAILADAGIRVDAWLGDFSFTEPKTGWTVRTAIDGLEVLQMGNRFSTCLALGGCNQFSTIANAIEANKRVLYVEDAAGKLRGRRLVGIRRDQLVAFDAFGVSNHGQWVRIVLDLACRRLAEQVGATLQPQGQAFSSFGDEVDLTLFADWYNDGAEEIDWWVREDGCPDTVRRELADPLRWDDRKPCIRAAIWLGDDPTTFAHLKASEHALIASANDSR